MQRFGLTSEEYNQLRIDIGLGKYVCSFRQSESRRHYDIVLNGKPATVVWNKPYKEIVTILERTVDGSQQTRESVAS